MTARRSAVAVVAGPPEEALLRSAAALRRLGARLTRYEQEAGSVEARLSRWGRVAVVRVAASATAGGDTRLTIESALEAGRFDFGLNARTLRRFQATLAVTPLPALERRRP